ncbi:helix-turn-helix domain-containing protein [Phytohabitans rumicis]|uniref:helix-turn-helix domain-containing protein n=1 Tax=Phytohabitans rumicis TaxID=1076125 RepID=UPI002483DBB6
MAANSNGSRGSLRARWLGEQMRQLRQARGLNVRHAAAMAGVHDADMKDYEDGRHILRYRQAARLLDLYQVHDPYEHDRLLDLARHAGQSPDNGSRNPGSPSHDPVLLDWLWLESQASRIRCHDTVLVPGLLQTPQYTAAANQPPRAAPTSQSLLKNLSGGLHAVVDESVLAQLVGGADVPRHQLLHLAEVIRAPNIHVQVLVSPSPGLDGMAGSFALFDVPSPYSAVVAVTHDTSGSAVHEGRPARRYAAAFDQLATTALDPRASAGLITSLSRQTP